mmetsp:Transcript_27958/g.64522  ORF Transcript_27958/g.64522 Transcript_27958/m.64522 type:complete len:476 (+) Transcript_27958:74-1501(+)
MPQQMHRPGDAVERLRKFNGTTPTPTPTEESMAQAEETEFLKLVSKEHELEAERCPSLRSIPRFYKPKRQYASPEAEENMQLQPKVLREARARLLHRKGLEELDEDDLHRIRNLLKEKAHVLDNDNEREVIDYQGFMSVRDELLRHSDRFRQFFTASTFLKFPRDEKACIAIVPFFTFVVRTVFIRQTRVQLGYYDTLGRGYLREKELENFIYELIPTLPQLSALQEGFYPFYVFTAVRKFFFYLDPKRTGRIHLRDVLSSQILLELYELRQEQPMSEKEASCNWFSMQSAFKVYKVYLGLDVDENGMLNRRELIRFGSGMLTDVFIDRVFEEYQTYRDVDSGEHEMDYKTFLDFVLAMENKNSQQAIQYFWKLIDVHHTGKIDGFVISYFFSAITRQLQEKNFDGGQASVDDVKDEIFDMVKAKEPNYITYEDLVNCGQGGTVLSMLIDAAAFWRYDNRESLMIDSDDEANPDL